MSCLVLTSSRGHGALMVGWHVHPKLLHHRPEGLGVNISQNDCTCYNYVYNLYYMLLRTYKQESQEGDKGGTQPWAPAFRGLHCSLWILFLTFCPWFKKEKYLGSCDLSHTCTLYLHGMLHIHYHFLLYCDVTVKI